MKTLIIDRRRWLRLSEDNYYGSSLCNSEDKKMCCLGFYLRSLGLSQKNFLDLAMPGDVKVNKRELGWLLKREKGKHDSYDSMELAGINDNYQTDDQFKEDKIKEIFKKHNVKVIFRN